MDTQRSRTAIRTLLLTATLVLPSVANAQHDGPGQRYLFGSFGSSGFYGTAEVGGGFGYEHVFRRGAGVGFEVEGFGTGGYGGVILSANGSYHFRNLDFSRRMVPFATAGFSTMATCGSGCGGISGVNFGGGVNYWIRPNRGLRLEFRDYALFDYGAMHRFEMRFGFAF